jgi:hypothetical protein
MFWVFKMSFFVDILAFLTWQLLGYSLKNLANFFPFRLVTLHSAQHYVCRELFHHNAECRYALCRYAECRSAFKTALFYWISAKILTPLRYTFAKDIIPNNTLVEHSRVGS